MAPRITIDPKTTPKEAIRLSTFKFTQTLYKKKKEHLAEKLRNTSTKRSWRIMTRLGGNGRSTM